MFLDQSGKLSPRKMLEQLIEQAGYLYDCLALLVGDVWQSPGQGLFANAHYRRACLLVIYQRKLSWTRVTDPVRLNHIRTV